ncbi:MAG: hypothetical protein Mars2KO_10650 [Maribacter sp.]
MNKVPDYQTANSLLSRAEKVGQLFMPAAFINDSEAEIEQLEHLIRTKGIGSLCFFHSRASAATNYEGKKEVVFNDASFETLKKLIERYQNASKYPLLIAIDAEWGLAMRIENTPQYPYALTLGAIQGNNDLIFQVGKNIAKDCKAAGIHWNLAPCVDVNSNPNNPVIGYRSFGADKLKVAEKALAFIKGAESEGILTSIKHFPGHGDTATDSHLGLPLVEKPRTELTANELYAFQQIIDKGVDSVMVGHLSVPSLANGETTSSSISPAIIKDLLRNDMGYQGVVISDALNMHAVSKEYSEKGQLEWLAFDAGNDVLCFAENVSEGITTILQKASSEQIEESFKRVWALKEKAIERDVSKTPRLTEPKQLNQTLAERSLTLLWGSESAIAQFRATDFCTLTLKRSASQPKLQDLPSEIRQMRSQVAEETDILVLLTPPQVKPANRFGFIKEEIDFINELIQTKNVVVYLFGNPYMLQHLSYEKATAVVVVYQDFTEFQDAATEHFLGKLSAEGKLPVSIF